MIQDLSSTFRIFGDGDRYRIAQKMSSEAMNVEGLIERQDGAAEWASVDPTLLPQRVIEHLDAVVLSGWPEARDRRAGVGTIERVAAVATFGEQLPSPAAEALDALDDRIFGHGAHDRAPGWRMSPAGLLRRRRNSILRLR